MQRNSKNYQTSEMGDWRGELLEEMSLERDSLRCLNQVVESLLPLGSLPGACFLVIPLDQDLFLPSDPYIVPGLKLRSGGKVSLSMKALSSPGTSCCSLLLTSVWVLGYLWTAVVLFWPSLVCGAGGTGLTAITGCLMPFG